MIIHDFSPIIILWSKLSLQYFFKGVIMTQSTNLQHSYSILVTEASDDYTSEWIGKVSLMPQENGDIYVSITFTSKADTNTDTAKQSANNKHRLSIDSY